MADSAKATLQEQGALIDSGWVRSQFPSLGVEQDGRQVAYFDNPAGTQVPARAVEAITHYLSTSNANAHGHFLTARRSDAVVAAARQAMADFLGAASPSQIAFGPNMTTLTFAISRAIGRDLRPGDELLVTDLDHDGNITPWLELAAERGATVRRVPVRLDDCTLDIEALGNLLSKRTRLVAVTAASNAIGTLPDIPRIARMVHDAGAWLWVDAVHYGPHGSLDVQAMDVDFLVCSAYKFFGPHIGIFYGKADLLERIRPYQLRPAPHTPPEKFETGTKNHECLAGLVATIDYLAELGKRAGPGIAGNREALVQAMTSIRAYERTLSAAMLEGFSQVPGLRVYGITDPARLDERVPTFALTIQGRTPDLIVDELGRRGIFAWSGNYYAIAIMESLGLEGNGGAVRVGAVHYNTPDEIDRLVAALKEIARA